MLGQWKADAFADKLMNLLGPIFQLGPHVVVVANRNTDKVSLLSVMLHPQRFRQRSDWSLPVTDT